ncbi:MAG: response regulator transcription factor [Sphingosinicella sp.]|nr:response regulator transcription factor [Sphingosinicella sp.]
MARIIFADDDELLRDVVLATLSAAGYVVGVVPDGETAVRAVILKRPDLVILDVMMPGIGGVEAVRQIRGSEVGYEIPILMLSARGHEGDVQIALRAGADDYLKKPFDPDQLIARAEVLLAERKRSF